MSRSYRHTPVIGITTARSDKPGKVIANRTLRAACRQALINCRDFDDLVMPHLREVSNVWSFPKDGKQRMMDKTASYFAKCMRK
jgi:hypothetical protein